MEKSGKKSANEIMLKIDLSSVSLIVNKNV